MKREIPRDEGSYMIENKLKIPYPIIVEGKYDRAAVLSVADAVVVKTYGFGIFKSHELRALLRTLAKKTPVIILTDSDGAGNLIRSHIKCILPPDRTISLYIPQIKGKEKRKSAPSAEGTLGVEGMTDQIIYDLLKPYERSGALNISNPLSKTDFFNDGLSGKSNSSGKRDIMAKMFGLPKGMSANALLEALRLLATYDEYKQAVKELAEDHQNGKS